VRFRFLGQDQKDSLAGVFGVGLRMQHPPANPMNHRRMPAYDSGKGGLIRRLGISGQERAIAENHFGPERPRHFGQNRRCSSCHDTAPGTASPIMCADRSVAARESIVDWVRLSVDGKITCSER
jgi:hypothetical protein